LLEADMPSLPDLWLPILLSAVAVFILSFVLHVFLKHHAGDMRRLAEEDELLAALRRTSATPGSYALPHATAATMGSPEFVAKRSGGVVGYLTVLPGGPPAMTKELVNWFVYSLVVSALVGYLAIRAVGPFDTDFKHVFHFVAIASFMAYGLGQVIESIWWARPWPVTIRNLFDAAIYALATAGVFGWLWPY
jgi:hypothetical protein